MIMSLFHSFIYIARCAGGVRRLAGWLVDLVTLDGVFVFFVVHHSLAIQRAGASR